VNNNVLICSGRMCTKYVFLRPHPWSPVCISWPAVTLGPSLTTIEQIASCRLSLCRLRPRQWRRRCLQCTVSLGCQPEFSASVRGIPDVFILTTGETRRKQIQRIFMYRVKVTWTVYHCDTFATSYLASSLKTGIRLNFRSTQICPFSGAVGHCGPHKRRKLIGLK
jgi:hypothetical protein